MKTFTGLGILSCFFLMVSNLKALKVKSRKSYFHKFQKPSKLKRDLNYPITAITLNTSKISKDMFSYSYDGKFPVVLRNAFDLHLENWTENLLSGLYKETIEFDVRKCKSNNDVETFSSILEDFLKECLHSYHDESFYMMNESILDNVEKLLDQITPTGDYFGENYFKYFPAQIRPKTALIIGGTGSRSFLHADPYEWTGWNLLLEGKKLWLFFPPDDHPDVNNEGELDGLFQPLRNSPDAWGSFNISAGWVSEVDLFRFKQDQKNNDSIGKTSLQKVIENYIKKQNSGVVKNEDDRNLSASTYESFYSGLPSVDQADLSLFRNVVVIVQEEGETVFIPPKWWHQVYHLEPSVAIASQYVNKIILDRVIKHILTWSNSADINWIQSKEYNNLTPKEKINHAIKKALLSQNPQKANCLIEDMYIAEINPS